jgi:3-dehydroquinate synthase
MVSDCWDSGLRLFAVGKVSNALWQGLKDTTKARDGLQRVPLMLGIGNAVFVNDISHAEVLSAAAALQTMAADSEAADLAFLENNNIVAGPVKAALAA